MKYIWLKDKEINSIIVNGVRYYNINSKDLKVKLKLIKAKRKTRV